MRFAASILVATFGFALLCAAQTAEPSGDWKAPARDGSPYTHTATGLTFPQMLGPYRLAGEFTYKDGGTLIRFENLDARARADIFLFRTAAQPATVEDQHRLLLKEMDTVETDMRAMAKQGRYKNLQFGDVVGREIDIWRQDPLPIAIRTLTATRVSSQSAVDEATIKQWIGITFVRGHILTIRHLRPVETGAEGESDMEAFVGNVYQVIKDPALRREIRNLIDAYHQDPFAPESEQAAAAVLAYLQQNPTVPIHIPEHPISGWLERIKAAAPGAEDHLLRAFMLGAAKSAFAGDDTAKTINEGARQYARVYRHLLPKHPAIALPDMLPFIEAAEKSAGAEWLRAHR